MDSIIIVGMKHSGKSSLGKGLATNLSIPFFDTDAIIEEQTKLPVRQLFVEKGESAFKNAEVESCKFLENQFQNNTSLVIATGGGICDNPEAIKILKSIGKFVLLNVPEKTCLERILHNSQKTGSLPGYISRENPKSQEDIKNIFHRFYERRMKSYREICDFEFYPNSVASKSQNTKEFVKFYQNTFPF